MQDITNGKVLSIFTEDIYTNNSYMCVCVHAHL